MRPSEFEGQNRRQLIEQAEGLGVERASVLTRAELIDEIIRRSIPDPIERRVARGLLGMARDLVARVVERGLHLPDAAERIRSSRFAAPLEPARRPIATVTLAEIYAAQGHRRRAIAVLDEVLAREPDHAAAAELRARIGPLANDEESQEPGPDELASPLLQEVGARASEDAATAGAPPAAIGADVAEAPAPPVAAEVAAPPVAAEVAAPPVAAEVAAPPLGRSARDALVLLPLDGQRAAVYWELSEATCARGREESSAHLIVRLLTVTPSRVAPRIEGRDAEVIGPYGGVVLRDLPPSALVRGAMGWNLADSFEPLAVALDAVAQVSASGESPAEAERRELIARGRRWLETCLGHAEADGLEADRLEADRLEADRLEADRLEADRLEADRLKMDRSWPSLPLVPETRLRPRAPLPSAEPAPAS